MFYLTFTIKIHLINHLYTCSPIITITIHTDTIMRSRIFNRGSTSSLKRVINPFVIQIRHFATDGKEFVHFRLPDGFKPQLQASMNKSLEGNTGGNTELHDIVLNGASPDDIEALVEQYGEDDVVDMAQTLNDDGYIPVDYVTMNNTKIVKPLSQLTLTYKPLTLLELEEMKVRYELNEGDRLLRTLAVSSMVVTQISQLNILSSSKPELNTVEGGISHAAHKLGRLRKTLGRFFIPLSEKLPHDYQGLKNIFVDAEAFLVEKFNVGNCHEYAYVAISRLREMDPSHRAEVFLMSNGNHVFVVLDRDPDSDPNDYTTWGQDAVVLDAWASDTFPASDIPNRLKANERHETFYLRPGSRGPMTDFSTYQRFNVATFFNPNHHKLRPLLCIDSKDNDKDQSVNNTSFHS